MSLTPGAVNIDPEETIHRHTHPGLNTRTNKQWNAVVGALAAGDQINWTNAQLAFDQLFKVSASGIYLDRRCSDDGILRPANIGMPDSLFRKLAIKESNNKVTEQALLEILEVFYGIDALRAYVETGLTEPYALTDQDGLSLLVDEKNLIPITFTQSSFTSIGSAKAIEVASAITAAFRAIKNNGFALAHFDPETNKNRVRIYSPSLGLGSAIRVTGGKAQNGLQFSTLLPIYTGVGALPTWTITFDALTSTLRFTSTTATGIDLSQLQVGDYVNVFGTEFLEVNRGSFSVTAVSVSYPAGILTQWFEVVNPSGSAQVFGAPQSEQADLLYFRPTKYTVQRAPTRAVVVSQGQSAVTVLLPTTTTVVGRGIGSGAYGQVNAPVAIGSMVRNSSGLVTVTAPTHGLPLPTADLPTLQLFIDGAVANTTPPSIVAGNPAASPPTLDYGLRSFASDLKTTTQSSCYRHVAIRVSTGDVLVLNGKNVASGTPSTRGVSELFSVLGTNTIGGVTQYKYNWLAATAFGVSLSWQSAVNVTSGTLVAGGIESGGAFSNVSKVYTAAVGGPGSWTSVGNLGTARAGHALVENAAGTLAYAIGGASSNTVSLASLEIYDAVAGTWSNGTAMGTARNNPTATRLANGYILVTGGRTMSAPTLMEYTGTANMGVPLQTCEVFNGSTWANTGSMTFARFGHTACLLPDGRVLVVGGLGYNPSHSSTPIAIREAEVWDPNTGLWSPAGSLTVGREFPTVTLVTSQNRIYVTGGTSKVIEYLDLSTGRWHVSRAELALQHLHAVGALMSFNGAPLILLTGGLKADGDTIDANTLVVPTSEYTCSGNLNGPVTATVVDANTFTFTTQNKDYSAATGGTATWIAGKTSTIRGPYTFDPIEGVAVTSTETTLTSALVKGHQYDSIPVTDATRFPDAPGVLCLAFGTEAMSSPVPYLGRLSPTALRIDYTFIMPHDIPTGSKVTLLYKRGGWSPANPIAAGCFYLTASASGRSAASKSLDDAAAGGISLIKVVEYPGDRGLGNSGSPDSGSYKVSDRVAVWGGDDLDNELTIARA